MIKQMRAKDGGGRIRVEIGDFADPRDEGMFSLVFVVANTFFALTTQDDQIRCFENVSARLEDRGVFLIEAFVPDVSVFADGNQLSARAYRSRLRENRRDDPRQTEPNRGHPDTATFARWRRSLPVSAAIRMAVGDGPDGTTNGIQTPRQMVGLEPFAVHFGEPISCVGVRKGIMGSLA